MATRKCGNISVSPELHAVATQALASGRHSSEVVRAALRLFDEHERRTSLLLKREQPQDEHA